VRSKHSGRRPKTQGQEKQARLPDAEMRQYVKYAQEDERLGDNLTKVTTQLESELVKRRSKFITRREISAYADGVPVF